MNYMSSIISTRVKVIRKHVFITLFSYNRTFFFIFNTITEKIHHLKVILIVSRIQLIFSRQHQCRVMYTTSYYLRRGK